LLKETINKDYKRFRESAGILMGNHDSSSTLYYFIISILCSVLGQSQCFPIPSTLSRVIFVILMM